MAYGDYIPVWRRLPQGGRSNAWNIIMGLVPLYDQEILGSLQLSFLPGIDRIPVLSMVREDTLWFVVLVVFIFVPYVDAEWLRLLEIYPEAWRT